MYDKCYFCLDQLPKLKKESTASFFVNFGGAGVQKSRPTLLYFDSVAPSSERKSKSESEDLDTSTLLLSQACAHPHLSQAT